MNILIVDDRSENNYLLTSLLKGKDHHVFSAANGEEALEILQNQKVDLIISDILMPVMDGYQLCRKVKTNPKLQKIPFIVYTATYTDPKDEEFAVKISADRFVIKPCDPKKLLRIIEEVMSNSKKTKPVDEKTQPPEEEVLKLYNERLVRKLEKKIEQYNEELKARLEAEEKLKSNLTLLKIAGNSARFGGWSVNLQDNICTWSDAVADIHEMPHGFAPKVEKGISFYAPEWRDKIIQVFSACAEKGIPYDEEMEIITKTGKRVWVRAIGVAEKNENGKIIRVHGSFQDISDKKQLALQESEANLRRMKEKLEVQVAEKTKELKERVEELERFHDATIQREFRIKELREEIEKLKN
ncbi:MAG: response regulator [Melioribacteraceae bacterium]|nr:response regulator [Melioribacteraceae bacterium]